MSDDLTPWTMPGITSAERARHLGSEIGFVIADERKVQQAIEAAVADKQAEIDRLRTAIQSVIDANEHVALAETEYTNTLEDNKGDVGLTASLDCDEAEGHVSAAQYQLTQAIEALLGAL